MKWYPATDSRQVEARIRPIAVPDVPASRRAGKPVRTERPHIEIRVAGQRDRLIQRLEPRHADRFPEAAAAWREAGTPGNNLGNNPGQAPSHAPGHTAKPNRRPR